MFQYYAAELSRPGSRREGWGSAEATEMVLNNLFYITAKVSLPLHIYIGVCCKLFNITQVIHKDA
jgi:hypothetical protein